METATATTRTEMVTATDTTEPAVWTDDDLARLIADEPMFRFVPRPDCPEEFDQQSSFLRSRAKVSIAMGGNRCLGAESEIYDPVAHCYRRIGEITGPFHVMSRNMETGSFEIAEASAPWVKGRDRLYRVSLSNGRSFVATMAHRVLDSRGTWVAVQDLSVGDVLIPSPALYESTVYSIEFVREDVFYDISVPGNENYQCAGVFHHNSGKTETAAQKCARFVLCDRDPPRPDTPFVVFSDTYKQVGNICWKEKLSRIIPKDSVDWPRVTWYSRKEQLPYVVPLRKRHGTDNNWQLEFHSLDSGRSKFQGRSFGGFWFSEQFEFEIFEEVLRGCSDYWFGGGQFAEFTPIDPDLSVAIEERMDSQPVGWEFFRLNTMRNTTLAKGFTDAFFSAVSPELLATRKTGAMPSFQGSIYPGFNPAIHVIDEAGWMRLFGKPAPPRYCDPAEFRRSMPAGWHFRRGMDWGESAEHPFVCLWGMKDGGGNWVVFDEYVEDTGAVLYAERREEIKLRWPWQNGNAFYGQAFADPSRPMLISEFNQAEIPTTAAQNSVKDGIEYVRKTMAVNRVTGRPGLLVYKPNCPKLIKGLRKYRWIRGVTEGKNPHVAQMAPLKWQDDEVDALRYMLYSDRSRLGRSEATPAIVADAKRHGVLLEGGRR